MTTLADRPRSDVAAGDSEAIDSRDPELRLSGLFDHDTMAPLRPRDASGEWRFSAAVKL